MEIHLTAVVQEAGLPITHCFWSDGGWVSFNGETKQWTNHGLVPRPSHFPKPALADAQRPWAVVIDGRVVDSGVGEVPRHYAEVATDD